MRSTRNRLAAFATLAGLLLVLGRGDLERLLGLARDLLPRLELVEDTAGILAPGQLDRIAEYHAALRAGHDIDYRVLTFSDGGDIAATAYRHFDAAGVGELSDNGRGLLLVIDTAVERVRLEVSTSLEGVYTDAFVSYLQNRQMAPFFKAGRVADGILAMTELIVARAQEAAAGSEFAPPMPAASMGGGATATAEIASAASPAAEYRRQTPVAAASGLNPLQIVERYHRTMADRDARADLEFYSTDSVRMLRDWVITPAQMDNVARAYRRCTVDAVRIREDLAVVRYGVEQRHCAPYFLRREQGEWKLDLAASFSSLRFNHENEWRLSGSAAKPYSFAFDDWRFDGNGFPHALR